MAETIYITAVEKTDIYKQLLPQIESLLKGEQFAIANMASMAAAIKQAFGHLWVGFYIVDGNELVVGPFQGPIACLRIKRGRGVCGSAWEQGKTVIVPNVNEFAGHIACSSLSQSEIVVPVRNHDGQILAVLDIDSAQIGTFDQIDAQWLETAVKLIYQQN